MAATSAALDEIAVLADRYWRAAACAALRAAEEADHVLVPHEFLAFNRKFAPLEFGWCLEDGSRVAWCCSKDDVDRLAPWLQASATDESHCAWANEVFVVGGNFDWKDDPHAESRRHLVAWHERLERYRQGIPARNAGERAVHGLLDDALQAVAQDASMRVLVVGASGMGNVGDDLIAHVLADMLAALGAEVFLSGPDIDPLRVRAYDAIIVGGGGLIYASRDGADERQNLANYLKFGPIGKHFGIPTALIGVGDQDHADGIVGNALTRQFAERALSMFDCVTTRDAESAALMGRLGVDNVESASDLVFAAAEHVRRAVRPSVVQPGRIGFAGEFYRFHAFADAIGDGDGPLAQQLREGDFDVLVMSNDDVEHARRMQQALQKAGASAAIVDLRDRDVEALVFLLASYTGLITTRFHGLVLAALVGVPVLAVDVADGKKARLLREIGAAQSLLVDTESKDSSEKLVEALVDGLTAIPAECVARLAEQTAVHHNRLRSLLNRSAARCGSQLGRARRHGKAESSGARSPMLEQDFDDAPLFGPDEAAQLCWAASSVETNGFANLGDSLSAVIVAGLADRPVRHLSFEAAQNKLVAIGSIAHAIRNGLAVIWGAGVSIRGGILAENVKRTRYDVRAIRGPISARHLRDFGIRVPDVFGDPAWLLPTLVNEPVEKKYELGVIPHIRDVSMHHPDAPPRPESVRCLVDDGDAGEGGIAVINTWHDATWEGLLAKLRLIRSCKRILSQSFHGVVIAEAYGIPVLNFRHLPGAANGALDIDLDETCSTDPRVWEFYKGAGTASFSMYSQRRVERTDWAAAIRAIDASWQPLELDAAGLVDAFPLSLAFDPLRECARSLKHVEALKF